MTQYFIDSKTKRKVKLMGNIDKNIVLVQRIDDRVLYRIDKKELIKMK